MDIKLKINCDMAEGFDSDAQIMPYIDYANICCGSYASDEETIFDTIRLAKKYNVKIGAHPGYRDRENFGRVSLDLLPEQITSEIIEQYFYLKNICDKECINIDYIKPHGALNNDMIEKKHVFTAICEGVSKISEMERKGKKENTIPLMTQLAKNHTDLSTIASKYNIKIIWETFADRAYEENGLLRSRKLVGAVHDDIHKIIKQIDLLNNQRKIIAYDQSTILEVPLSETICIHGDNPPSIEAIIKLARQT